MTEQISCVEYVVEHASEVICKIGELQVVTSVGPFQIMNMAQLVVFLSVLCASVFRQKSSIGQALEVRMINGYFACIQELCDA